MGTSESHRLSLQSLGRTPMVFPGMIRGRKKKAFDRAERLENRLYWSTVYTDANGWTQMSPSPGENIIYVSNEGSNSNNGTSPATSVQTIQQGMKLMKTGQANELLLASGETFLNKIGTSNNSNNVLAGWNYSGGDLNNPIVISSYGTGARPLVYTNTNGTAFSTFNATTNVNYVDLIGIQFDANLRDPTLGTVAVSSVNGGNKGFEFLASGGNMRVEDCSFNYYGYNVDIESPPGPIVVSNITLYRDTIANAYAFSGGRSQGMYVYNADRITVSQCDFDHNGWNATAGLGSTDIGYNHNMYFASTCTNVDVDNSIIAEASYCGVLARAGGIINNNLFIGNTVACSYGSGDGADSTVGGVTGTFIGNTIVGDKAEYSDTSSPLAYGQGLVIANVNSQGLMISGNLFTQDSQNAKACIQLYMATGTGNPQDCVGLNNVTIQNNIFNGWRWTVQMDGRFVPGGTGIYALNNLKITKNDIVTPTSGTVSLVRHDGAFSPSAESWSLDRYYDPAASTKWITLSANALAFSTWASTYDTGATALSALPYSDPTRNISTYSLSIGGTGTSDFLAKAALVNINNYPTQYLAAAAASYVQAGFNLVAGTSNMAPTTAAAATTNVNTLQLAATTYSFKVNFTGGGGLKTSTLGTGNLLVTGPNGFSQIASYVSVAAATTDSAGYQHTAATYKITPPNGSWTVNKKQEGNYTVTMLVNQVSDLNGNIVPDGVLGTFAVDLTPPTANVNALPVTATASSYGFSIEYLDAAGIDSNTLYSGELQVTGPNGYSQYATLGLTTASSNGNGIVASYTITPPGGSWASTANGTYSINVGANLIYDLSGNPLASGTLGSFVVNLNGGSTNGSASIAGIVFNDANGDGVMGTRELPMVGVTMFIDTAGTGVYMPGETTAITDSNGAYSFTLLTAGRYTIAETAPAGYGVTTPSTGTTTVTVTTGQAATGFNFANQLGAVTISSFGNTTTTTSNSNGSTGTTTVSTAPNTPVTTTTPPVVVTPPVPVTTPPAPVKTPPAPVKAPPPVVKAPAPVVKKTVVMTPPPPVVVKKK